MKSRRQARTVALSAIAFLVMSAVPAFAACAFGCSGGVDLFFDRTQYLWPGQTVTWSTEVFLDKGAAGPEDGPFFAYLVEAGRPVGNAPHVEDGVRLGTVETSTGHDPHYFVASVSFTVPVSTPLGEYVVEVCDDPCANRLAYLWGTPVGVVTGDIEARLNERIDSLATKVSNLRWSMKNHAQREAKRSSNVLRVEMAVTEEKLDMRISELERGLVDFEKRLALQEEAAERGDVSQSALAGGVVVFLLGAWLVRERRRNSL